jgi:hypothetical protein
MNYVCKYILRMFAVIIVVVIVALAVVYLAGWLDKYLLLYGIPTYSSITSNNNAAVVVTPSTNYTNSSVAPSTPAYVATPSVVVAPAVAPPLTVSSGTNTGVVGNVGTVVNNGVGGSSTTQVSVPTKASVKYIKFYRSAPGIIQLNEVMAYDMNGNLLPLTAFSKIEMSSCRSCKGDWMNPHVPNWNIYGDNDPWYVFDGVTELADPDNTSTNHLHTGKYGVGDVGNHWVVITLANAMPLSKVVVFTAQFTANDRNPGTRFSLLDSNNNVLYDIPFTGALQYTAKY